MSYGLENAFYDAAIARIAALAGDKEAEKTYTHRATLWKNYFDHDPAAYAEFGATGFMRPKLINGDFLAPFSPYQQGEHENGNYTEGNAWQWTWFVPHDVKGLQKLMGGEADFTKNLDATFTAKITGEETADMSGLIGQVAFGNEPSHHIPYLYNWTAKPWQTQEVVDYILAEMYTDEAAGVIGNEDVGAMSAWYIMSAMGFYQVDAANPVYTVGRPLFSKVVLPVKNGTFTITAENNSPENKYIQSVTINGQPLKDKLFFNHSDLIAGGNLHFVMTNKKK